MNDEPPPSVMIVGAGLGGLTLAILLQRAGIEYQVFEKSTEIKPFGSAIALGPNILPLFTQLGLYEEFLAIAKPVNHITIHKAQGMRRMGAVDIEEHIERSGYSSYVCSRPDLYDLLISQIPKSRISFGKRVLSLVQGDNGAQIQTADGGVYEADILVGADGGYSAVRQAMYEKLKKKGLIPPADLEKMALNHTTMVGVTRPLDLDKYPLLRQQYKSFSRADWVIGHGPFTWSYFSLTNNRIGWGFGTQILTEELQRENDTTRSSDWGPESTQALCGQIQDYEIPIGGTMGDLIHETPRDSISRMMLEEKLFETWYHQRTVLIGDACHRISPYSGQGPVNAMEDAVILANAIYEIRAVNSENITTAFQDYYEERYPHAVEQLKFSKLFTMLMAGQTWKESLMRRFVLSHMSKYFQRRNYAKTLNYRPQASFLPRVPDRGIIPVLPQKPSKRYEERLLAERLAANTASKVPSSGFMATAASAV
ncbi:FAD/NAD(P)-binding domain-containing protein [Linnemannia elongata AG-77]|uniref:FAD/NAD(P)-binding domain-containing protein n=1 Tax=Linnemannia elongata AG-77 TaxID=1314771 RepID=A0A197KCE9_9FUNG|nr:FAD/NAD(P)-binding domain-containing protein [Linnemannia elongata AG-77]